MKNLVKILAIVTILGVSCFLYFHKLDSVPPGVYVDEAADGYNAYSILLTGKDEYGYNFPIYFRLMGSYSPSIFIYLAAIFIKLFGLQIVVLRSISAISMLLGTLFFYLILKELKLYKSKLTYFAITLFYAISPWIVFNARLGYETTLGYLVFNIGVYFLVLARRIPKSLILGVIFISISTYVSHNQRFLAPLCLIGYVLMVRKAIFFKENLKVVAVATLIGLFTQIPNLVLITTNAFWIKSAQFGLSNIGRILVYLSPKTLFFENPDIDMQHTLPKISLLFNWMVIPFFIGVYQVLKQTKDFKYKFLILLSVVTLIPSVFSGYFVSNQRVLPFAVPLFAIVGIGMDVVFSRLSLRLRLITVLLLATYSSIVLFSSYFVLFPIERAQGWDYGYDQVAQYIEANPKQSFLFDNRQNPRAYILFLYFMKVAPALYQNEVDSYYRDNYYKAPPPADSYKFQNVEVRGIDWEHDPQKDLVLIGDPLTISDDQAREHNLTKISGIKDTQNNVIFNMFKTK
jgi:hypothetical protein